MNMNKLFSLLLGATLAFSVVQTVNAAGQSNCQIIYGGGEVCEEQVKFTINKLVQKPGKGGGDLLKISQLPIPELLQTKM